MKIKIHIEPEDETDEDIADITNAIDQIARQFNVEPEFYDVARIDIEIMEVH